MYLFIFHARVDKLFQLLHDQGHFGADGEAVQTADLPVRVGFFIDGLGLDAGVVAAGQIAGDGDGEHALRIAKGFHPFRHIGAGSTGFALVCGQVGKHRAGVQRGVIGVFLGAGDDLQRDTGEGDAPEGKQVGRRVRNDFIIHEKVPRIRVEFIGFLKTDNIISNSLCKVKDNLKTGFANR